MISFSFTLCKAKRSTFTHIALWLSVQHTVLVISMYGIRRFEILRKKKSEFCLVYKIFGLVSEDFHYSLFGFGGVMGQEFVYVMMTKLPVLLNIYFMRVLDYVKSKYREQLKLGTHYKISCLILPTIQSWAPVSTIWCTIYSV